MAARSNLLALPLGALALGACARSGPAPAPDAPADMTAWLPDRAAFEPARLRVHPLSRITKDGAGTPVLALHLELRDASNQVVKSLGIVRVQVQAGASDAPLREWEVDLRDPARNADLFDDVVTRTYALRLGNLPPELARLADAPAPADAGALRVTARFLFKDTSGDVRQLEAERSLTGP